MEVYQSIVCLLSMELTKNCENMTAKFVAKLSYFVRCFAFSNFQANLLVVLSDAIPR